MPATDPHAPIDSATVILLREAAPETCEVLLVERHADSRAFAGAHVFPGGRIDEADRDPRLQAAARLDATLAAARLGEDLPPPAALAFWIAAIRELFEEAGILLASIEGAPVDSSDPATGRRFAAARAELLAGTLTFRELVERERLELGTDMLWYFSRWITPVHAPRRYDARFFVALLPPGQAPLHDDRETTSTSWLTPADALARAASGRLVLAPPTTRTLDDLHHLGSCARIVESAGNHRVTPILPRVVSIGGRTTLLYPGDVDYERHAPLVASEDSDAGPLNRLVMEGSSWRSVRSR